MKRIGVGGVVVLVIVLVANWSHALIIGPSPARVPESWPDAIKSLSTKPQLQQVAHGCQEDYYDFTFQSRDEFESAWPAFVSLLESGAPLVLVTGSTRDRGLPSAEGTHLRVKCPCATSQPMPAWVQTEHPEYVNRIGNGPEDVVRGDPETDAIFARFYASHYLRPLNRRGFYFRARTDLVLIVDGDIVDLNRIKLPADTPIIDRRFE